MPGASGYQVSQMSHVSNVKNRFTLFRLFQGWAGKSGTHNSVIYCLTLAYNDTSGMWIIAESTQKVVTSVTLVTGHKSKYSMFYTLKTEIGFKN
jgi:predicted DNA binding protein